MKVLHLVVLVVGELGLSHAIIRGLGLFSSRHRCSASRIRSQEDAIKTGIEAFLASDEMLQMINNMDADGDEDEEAWEDDEDEDDEEEFIGADFAARVQQELVDELDYAAKALKEQAFLGPGEPLPLELSCQGAEAAAMAVSAIGPGVVRLQSALSAQTASQLRTFVLAELETARGQSDGGLDHRAETRLSNVLAPEARWDLRLPMRGPVRTALRELLGEGSLLGGAFEIAAGGPSAELWELAALISAPGATAQIVHADCDGAPQPELLHTAFVALQPVTRALGPTRWLPNSHVDAAGYSAFSAQGDVTVLRGTTSETAPLSYVGLLDTGDASLYDGRILHCGGANTVYTSANGVVDGAANADSADGDGVRILFYMTFRSANREDVISNPAARSILTRYDGHVTLGMLRDKERGFEGD